MLTDFNACSTLLTLNHVCPTCFQFALGSLLQRLHKEFADMMTNKKKMVALQNLCPQAKGDDFDTLHSSIVDVANKVQLRKLCMHVTPSGNRSEAVYQKFAKASKEELQDELRKAWNL